jgi:DNA repair protein RecN (Recombination protein N)
MSLQRISLRDFVIVRQLELEFGAGFTVLSGETGAGKSILIDALQLVLGARAEASVVREGAARSELCAEFSTPAHLQPWLQDNGFDAADDLLLKRSIDAQGKSRAWINGSPATASQLREIGDQLLDIHGQHAWQSLTRPSAVRELLDAFAQIPRTSFAKSLEQLAAKPANLGTRPLGARPIAARTRTTELANQRGGQTLTRR